MVVFLTKLKKGHCQYFAGAMTLLCQSLGMQARVVSGFKCDEYNSAGHYFEVRQSHAHAWVEVRTPWRLGFLRSRPVPPPAGPTTPSPAPCAIGIDYLQYAWGNSVVAYTGSVRNNLVTSLEDQLERRVIHATA